MHPKFFTLPNSLLLKQGECASSNNNVGAYPYPLLSLSPYSTWFSLLITLNTATLKVSILIPHLHLNYNWIFQMQGKFTQVGFKLNIPQINLLNENNNYNHNGNWKTSYSSMRAVLVCFYDQYYICKTLGQSSVCIT